MLLSIAQLTLKPGVDQGELLRLYDELAIPIFRKIPGCLSVNVLKYMPCGTSRPQWDYAIIQMWESEEAKDRAARDKYIGFDGSQMQKTGFYEKINEIMDEIHVINLPVSEF